MALNIKNREVEELASELAQLEGVSKTEVIRSALVDRKARLSKRPRSHADEILEREIWSQIPEEFKGKGIAFEDHSELMGWGPEGY